MGQAPSLKAGGDINPSRFIRLDTSDDNTAVECSAATAAILGISTDATKVAPQDGASTLAAEAGDHVEWRKDGDVALLELGTGGATRGDTLTSDANGQGITTTTDANFYGAIALESGSAGDKIEVLVTAYRQRAS